MAELSDLTKPADTPLTVQRARVISISGRSLTVDIGGPVVIASLDSCNPKPDQWVYIIGEGTSMMAIGAVGGPYRQATLTVTADATDTVTGLLNGVSTAVGKAWVFTATIGDVLPLLWSPDGSNVTALGLPGAAYIPPSDGGGGGTNPGGGGGTTTHTSYYAAVSSGTQGTSAVGGNLSSYVPGFSYGYYRYGFGRMNELSGRTIVSGQIYLPRVSGSGSATLKVGTNPSSTLVSTGGWVSLPGTRIAELIASPVIVQTEVRLSGFLGVIKGVPAGTVQIVWR